MDLNPEQWGDMQCQPNPRHPIRGLMNSVGTMPCGCHHRLPTTAAPQRIAERIEQQWGKSFWIAPVDSPYDDRDSHAHAHQKGLPL